MPSVADDVLKHINEEELVNLALALGQIESPYGKERGVADFLLGWLKEQGFAPQSVALMPERPNVMALWRGTGGGYRLAFNSHMDTGRPRTDHWVLRNPDNPIFYSAWLEGDTLVGDGIVNDKGPMAAFLIAAKAIKAAGIQLKGDLLLTMVSGEIGVEPVDEFQPPQYLSKEVGTRFLIQHGGIADFALVAEGTDFAVAGVEPGKLFLKITAYGRETYTPFLKRGETIGDHPNSIVRMAELIRCLETWAVAYEKTHRLETPLGTCQAKVNIGAIRGGLPYRSTRSPEVCSIYVDCRILPGQDPLDTARQVEEALAALPFETNVQPYGYRRGVVAKNAEPLVESIRRSHEAHFGRALEVAPPPVCSMWRDIICFNEMGIPSVTYGPPRAAEGTGKMRMKTKDLLATAQVYARIALDLCNREKPAAGV